MPERISRRELSKRGLLGLAALTVPTSVVSQQPTAPPPDPEIDRKLQATEKKLAKPLSEDTKKLTKAAIGNVEAQSAARLEVKLPENSEPCFLYVPAKVKGRRS